MGNPINGFTTVVCVKMIFSSPDKLTQVIRAGFVKSCLMQLNISVVLVPVLSSATLLGRSLHELLL